MALSTVSVHRDGHEANAEREKGRCSGCGTTRRALMAPISNPRGYEGPMYCLPCNPRFGGGMMDTHYSCLERMGS